MKYIIINHCHPIIFDNYLTHDIFKDTFNNLSGKITSAGFMNILNNKVVCSGRSISLGLEPSKTDEEIIASYLWKD
jgi:hypothetical protein